MPPRIPRPASVRLRTGRLLLGRSYSSRCLICEQIDLPSRRPSIARRTPPSPSQPSFIRRQSSLAKESSSDAQVHSKTPRISVADLKQALIDVSRLAPSYVNISRLQLALRGFEQRAGYETIRVAFLASHGQGLATVKELVRLIVADPLKAEEEWERILTESGDKPFLLKIGKDLHDESAQFSGNRLLQELRISSPVLNPYNLEILVLHTAIPSDTDGRSGFAERVLVPTMDIPTSSTGRYTSVTTPVHKALIVGDGIKGAASLLQLPTTLDPTLISFAANIPGFIGGKDELPFELIDVSAAKDALDLFREDIGNAMEYEHGWFDSGLPALVDWIKTGTSATTDADHLKVPVHVLITSLLDNAANRIQQQEWRTNAALLSSAVSSTSMQALSSGLQAWAERAHTELRDQLDIAFQGRRWRKLGWWKLFWRVDDVSMISTDILQQRFLTEAEKEVIYLAGQIDAAGVLKDSPTPNSFKNDIEIPATLGTLSPPPRFRDLVNKPDDNGVPAVRPQPWPLHIPSARSYLATDTVPALQALAQKLVLQTLTTSSFSTAFAGLIYVSTITTGLYEAGAVAAFGIVWSMRRMQKKWETARTFWEGEVREEGRKAVRAVESSVENVLTTPPASTTEGVGELESARKAVETAKSVLKDFTAGAHK